MYAATTIRNWFIASRPWSCSVSAMPVALGAALAWHHTGQLHLGLFIITLIAGVCLHLGTNYINTYGDFIHGVDTLESARTCPELVTGKFSARGMKIMGLATMGIAVLLGLILTWLAGWPVLIYGLIGLAGGYCYTAGIAPYKYKGLGPSLVFLLMGPLMVAPAYYIQTGLTELTPFMASLPTAFLVTGVIQSNDLRDIKNDRLSGIKTMAGFLGRNRALFVYRAMYAGAHLSIIILVLSGIAPWPALLPLLLLPETIRVLRSFDLKKNPSCLDGLEGDRLEGWSAGFHFRFNALYIAGLVLATAWRFWFAAGV